MLHPLLLPCIEMAKIAGESVLLSYWFKIQIIDVIGHCSRVRVRRCPHSGTEIAAPSRKLVFLIYFLWHPGCNSYRRSTKWHATCHAVGGASVRRGPS